MEQVEAGEEEQDDEEAVPAPLAPLRGRQRANRAAPYRSPYMMRESRKRRVNYTFFFICRRINGQSHEFRKTKKNIIFQ